MENSLKKLLQGYQSFRKKYALGDQSIMHYLAHYGQQPQVMVISCCDSRVDPALILQCDPGDLFVVRNVANIIPPYEKDGAYHGTSAALEFGICFLKVKHLILFGHSQCGGIQALLNNNITKNDFITNWVSIIKPEDTALQHADDYAKLALKQSYQNCLTFPWISEKIMQQELIIHLWYFDIKYGQIFTYLQTKNTFQPLDF
ncbi:MAG: carbonate dehydratase [Gammaproteobacteria bacterium RIFCSPHIGHO2_12_FULL_41_20]|nr:MAG: carbonate dehydratase [Gammaproteobacteria bacterium RIFCSPHIGHO2_12_FULL_41_20]